MIDNIIGIILLLAFLALASSNVATVYYCQKSGGQAVTPFLTTECRGK